MASWKPTKTKVLVAVLTGQERFYWINPGLAMWLIRMSHSANFDVEVTCINELRPVDHARNYAVVQARDKYHADWLLMVDADQDFTRDPLDALVTTGKQVIGLPSISFAPVEEQKNGKRLIPNVWGRLSVQGDFMEVARVGAGALFIHRSVWEQVPGPWFRTVLSDDEQTSLKAGEDIYFCDRVREHGIRVWIAGKHGVRHFHTCELSQLACEMEPGR